MISTWFDTDARYERSVERWARWMAFTDRHPWLFRILPGRLK